MLIHTQLSSTFDSANKLAGPVSEPLEHHVCLIGLVFARHRKDSHSTTTHLDGLTAAILDELFLSYSERFVQERKCCDWVAQGLGRYLGMCACQIDDAHRDAIVARTVLSCEDPLNVLKSMSGLK